MSFRNHNSEISAKISKTLGPKFQNARNFIMSVFGGALEKSVLSSAKILLNFQVLGTETLKRRGPYRISGKPGKVVQSFLGTLGGSYGSAREGG
jgi:hypothetical protein